MITMKRQAAGRAVVPANRQVLTDLFAARACLACSSRVNFHDLNASVFCFAFQDSNEAGPSSVTDRTGQPAVLEHIRYVQAFDSDESVATDQLDRSRVVMFATEISDSIVYFSEPTSKLASPAATLSLSANSSPCAAKSRDCSPEVSRIRLVVSVASRKERLQSNVNAHAAAITGWRSARNLYRKNRRTICRDRE